MTFDAGKAARLADAHATGKNPAHPIPQDAVSFAERYLPFTLSDAWRVFLAALVGLVIPPALVGTLRTICGHDRPLPGGYREALAVTGRRGGKSAVIACLGTFIATVEGAEHMRFLAPGQRGYIAIISRSIRQALEVFNYARAIVERNHELLSLLDGDPLQSLDGGELRFINGVTLTVMPASKASVRGFTVIGAILDEFAWLATDDEAVNADEEIDAAIRFAMLAPMGAPTRRKVIISSPAAKSGIVYALYQEHHGKPDAPVLVAHGETTLWNPSIDPAILASEKARDPRRYRREVLAEFVDAISAWCDGEVINSAAEGRNVEPLPPSNTQYYAAGCDMAFKRDSSSLAIGHREYGKLIVDGIWRWTPEPGAPLDARAVVGQMASILRSYGCYRVLGDQFAVVPLASMFEEEGIALVEETATNRNKLENYTALKELFYMRKVSLPNNPVALKELRELQERMTSGGNIVIGHPNRSTAHDDCASAIAWLCSALESVLTLGEGPITLGTRRGEEPVARPSAGADPSMLYWPDSEDDDHGGNEFSIQTRSRWS